MNEGFNYATGIYWTWTSDDNRYKKNAFQEMSLFLDMNNETGLVCCDYDRIDGEGNLLETIVLSDPQEMILLNTVGACFLYRSEIAKELGKYKPELFLVEDYEYWLRFFIFSKINV